MADEGCCEGCLKLSGCLFWAIILLAIIIVGAIGWLR
jgi:hypothetical protein